MNLAYAHILHLKGRWKCLPCFFGLPLGCVTFPLRERARREHGRTRWSWKITACVCACVCDFFIFIFLYISSLFWEIWMLIHSSKSKLYSEDFAAKIMQSSSALDLVFISPSSYTYLLIQIKDESAACEIYIDICSMYIWVSGLTVAHLSANPLKYPAHTVLFKCNI